MPESVGRLLIKNLDKKLRRMLDSNLIEELMYDISGRHQCG